VQLSQVAATTQPLEQPATQPVVTEPAVVQPMPAYTLQAAAPAPAPAMKKEEEDDDEDDDKVKIEIEIVRARCPLPAFFLPCSCVRCC
jgi:hypothetical protein